MAELTREFSLLVTANSREERSGLLQRVHGVIQDLKFFRGVVVPSLASGASGLETDSYDADLKQTGIGVLDTGLGIVAVQFLNNQDRVQARNALIESNLYVMDGDNPLPLQR